MASLASQYKTSNNSQTNTNNDLAIHDSSQRASDVSIFSLLNPDAEKINNHNHQNYNHYNDEVKSEDNYSQNWRRYSAPNLSSESMNDLTIINYCGNPSHNQNNNTSKNHHQHVSSLFSRSTPSSPKSANTFYQSTTKKSAADSAAAVQSSMKSTSRSNYQFPSSDAISAVNNNAHHIPPKVKRKRFTQEQLVDLIAMFEQTDTPNYEIREKLAKKLNMTNREVQVWFQNRRAKANRAKANEPNASNHHHHRFLHHHSVTPAQAASGHASSVSNIPTQSNYTFVAMFTDGIPSSGGHHSKGNNGRRHSYHPTSASSKKTSNNSSQTRPRATTVSHLPTTATTTTSSHNTNSFVSSSSSSSSHNLQPPQQQNSPTTPNTPSPKQVPILPPPIPSQYPSSSYNPYLITPINDFSHMTIGGSHHQLPRHSIQHNNMQEDNNVKIILDPIDARILNEIIHALTTTAKQSPKLPSVNTDTVLL
ncbi:378_t:CDS:2 [Ambispora gerdemannii]|uniref:378_t:CDS:1 n=1 Tax=Ambispora gerdemannii TaxID=144530 RepID=A0A9N8VPK1_9GLOM|nr:378_t:CDS:2 [Ambispora gerdemannii]